MRLVLTLRGVDVVYLELLWPTKPGSDEAPTTIEASGGGSFDRADSYGDPATLHGFGFSTEVRDG